MKYYYVSFARKTDDIAELLNSTESHASGLYDIMTISALPHLDGVWLIVLRFVLRPSEEPEFDEEEIKRKLGFTQ
jgi:hypothetical protein